MEPAVLGENPSSASGWNMGSGTRQDAVRDSRDGCAPRETRHPKPYDPGSLPLRILFDPIFQELLECGAGGGFGRFIP